MGLPKSRLPVPFIGGVETKTDPKSVPPTKLLTLENGRFTVPGRIEKRNSMTDHGVTVNETGKKILEGNGLICDGTELLQFGQRSHDTDFIYAADYPRLFKYNSKSGEWHGAGPGVPVDVSVQHLGQTISYTSLVGAGVCKTNDYTAYVWEDFDNSAAYLTILDDATGNHVVDKHLIGANGFESPRIYTIGDKFYILCGDQANNDIYLTIIDTDDLSDPLPSESAVITDKRAVAHPGGRLWDSCRCTDLIHGECILLAYENTTPQIVMKMIDSAGAVQRTNNTGDVVHGSLSVSYQYDYNSAASYIPLIWHDSGTNDIKLRLYNPDLTTAVATVVIYNLAKTSYSITSVEEKCYASLAGNSSMAIFVSYLNGAGDPCVDACYYAYSGVSFGVKNHYPYCVLSSKAFNHNDRAYVMTSSWHGGYFLKSNAWEESSASVTYNPFVPNVSASIFGYGRGGMLFMYWPGLNDVVYDSGVAQFAGMKYDRLDSEAGVIGGLVGITMDFTAKNTQHDKIDRCLLTDGAVPGLYDGAYSDLGFMHRPKISNGTAGDPGGSMSDGTRYYKVVYEYTDRKGQIHRSEPSAAKEVVFSAGTATQDCDLDVFSLVEGVPHKMNDTKIVVYRTVDAGTIYYRTGAYAVNALETTLSATITDTISDASLISNEALYTTGGVESNFGVPPTKDLVCRRDRTFSINAEDPADILYSKPKVAAVGVEHAYSGVKRVPIGGDSVALSILDDKVIVFKNHQIRAFAGQGPNAAGGGQPFTDDRLITDEVGCKDKRSVVSFGHGVFFKSHKGFYLLGRNEAVSYIGSAVESWNDETCINAVHVENENQVRFLMSSDDVLVFDYFAKQWSVYKYTFGTGVDGVDLVLYDDKPAILLDTGVVWTEDPYYYDTGTTPIQMLIETAWIKKSSLAGADRIWWIYILGQYKSAHTLTVEVYYDFEQSAAETVTIESGPNADEGAYSADDTFEHRIWASRGRCQAIKLKIYDSSLNKEGCSLSGLEFEVGTARGMKKLRASKSK